MVLNAEMDEHLGYPKHLLIVHMVRNSTKFVSWKERKELYAYLKTIYSSATIEQAELNLQAFGDKRNDKYSSADKLWQKHWKHG
jgi:putative transposase